MDYPSIAILAVSFSSVYLIIRRAKRNDKLAAMTDSELFDAGLQENLEGRYDNPFSYELRNRCIAQTTEKSC